MSGADPPGLVVFSPLPPTPSGIADYTAELLPALAPLVPGPVTVVVAREADAVPPPPGAAAVLPERAYRARPALHAAPHLHMLGNSLDHAHVYRALLRRPGGVLALHDPVLHHLVEALTLGRGSPHAYAAALARDHGPAGLRLARLRRLGLFSPAQRYLLPLHGAALDAAGAVVVHSRFAAGRLLAAAPPGLPVHVVPHHATPRAAAYDGVARAEARARLGLPAEARLLLALGHVTPAKQVDRAVAALAALRAAQGGAFADVHLVVGGAVEPGLGLAAQVAALGLADRVRATGWLPEEAFFLHLRAADLLLALRFPTGGESSGTLARALAMGTAALAYDAGPPAELPDEVVAKLPFPAASEDPVAVLAGRLAALLADPAALAGRGAAARRWARTALAVARSAEAYAAAIRRNGDTGPR